MKLPTAVEGRSVQQERDPCSRGKGTSCCWFLALDTPGEAQNFTQFVNLMS